MRVKNEHESSGEVQKWDFQDQIQSDQNVRSACYRWSDEGCQPLVAWHLQTYSRLGSPKQPTHIVVHCTCEQSSLEKSWKFLGWCGILATAISATTWVMRIVILGSCITMLHHVRLVAEWDAFTPYALPADVSTARSGRMKDRITVRTNARTTNAY